MPYICNFKTPLKHPSFFARYKRKPIAGVDYDPEKSMCQDDYEYYTGTGRYTDEDQSLPYSVVTEVAP